MTAKGWTNDQISLAHRLRGEGLSYKEIGLRVGGRSASTVRWALWRYADGIKSRPTLRTADDMHLRMADVLEKISESGVLSHDLRRGMAEKYNVSVAQIQNDVRALVLGGFLGQTGRCGRFNTYAMLKPYDEAVVAEARENAGLRRKVRPDNQQVTIRKCMTCGVEIKSEGPHHRLCSLHRQEQALNTYRVAGSRF